MNTRSDATKGRKAGGQEPLNPIDPAAPSINAAPREPGPNLPDDLKTIDGRALMERLRALASQI